MAVSGLKLFADGGYSARNAAARTPYLNPDGSAGHMGKVNLSVEEIADAMRRTAAAGMQLAVHGNGERAQDIICEGILGSGVEEPTAPRIEHAGNVLTDFAATELWRRASVIPVPQPVFLYNFGEGLASYLGPSVEKGRFPFRSLLDAGWRISGSSDCHLGCEERQTNPLFSVWCCVAREGFHGNPIQPEETISVIEALRMHTLYAAEAIRQEDDRGSLEPGKRADVIVLDRDPRQVSTSELPDVKVDFVFVDGRQVHAREGAQPAMTKEVV
jgi:predicted amidohydrolase YtcJ